MNLFDEFQHCLRVWNVSAPGDDGRHAELRKKFPMHQRIFFPETHGASDRDRITQTVLGHDRCIGMQIADKGDVQMLIVLTEPVGKFTLDIGPLRQDQRLV